MPKVYIIILNYNNWSDTIECLESIYGLHYTPFQVIVVDNCSTDNSVKNLRLWATGQLLRKSLPQTSSPLPKHTKLQAQSLLLKEIHEHELNSTAASGDNTLILINAAENKGFAAGNNLGLKYALMQQDFAYAWLLNNDTVTEADTLTHLVASYKILRQAQVKVGLLGCKVLYYDQPNVVQCAGGAVYNPWTGYIKQVGNKKLDKDVALEKPLLLDYISGASMFFDKQFLEEVGLMEEKYFLYFEEFDWAKRSIQAGYTLSYVPEARIYHKEGGTISKKEGTVIEKSKLADFYFLRSKILFTQQFYPQCLPTVYLGILYTLLNRIRRGQTDRIKMLLKLSMNPHIHYQDALK